MYLGLYGINLRRSNIMCRVRHQQWIDLLPLTWSIWPSRRKRDLLGHQILRRDHFLHANSRFCSVSGGLAGRDDGDVGGGDFTAFVVEVADVDRAVGAAYPAEHAGALGAGQVLVTPLLQRAEDHLEFLAGRGEPVRETGPGAGLAVRLTGHDAVLDQGGQPVGQDVGGHTEPVAELGEPGRAQEGLAQDQEGPALPDHAQGPRDRARLRRVLRHAPSIPRWVGFLDPAMLGWKNLLRRERV